VALNLGPPKGPVRYKYVDAVHNDDFPEFGVTGPFATGKSYMMVDKIGRRSSLYPGSNILLARGTLTSLKDSTIPLMRKRIGAIFKHENMQEAVFRLPPEEDPLTGTPVESTVTGVGLDRVDLEQLLTSTAFSFVGMEEADEIPVKAHDMVLERARQLVFHKYKKVYHLCMHLASVWGNAIGRVMSPDEVYQILLADPRNAVGQRQLEYDGPMPGRTQVFSIWNPKPDDLMWQRFVGVPYPFPRPTPEWVQRNVGVREVHKDPETLINDHFEFQAGSIVKLPDGSRSFCAFHDIDKGTVKLVDGRVIDQEQAGLIVQRNCIYVFDWENESRDYKAVENSYLMQDQAMRKRHQKGEFHAREGRVFRNFVDEYVELGGHKLHYPGKERILRQAAAAHLRIIGGLDQGGAHSTAFLLCLYLPRTKTLLAFHEYVHSDESARSSAYDLQAALGNLPGVEYLVGYDPAMNHRIFDEDSEKRQVDNYTEVIGEENMLPGARGEEAFDEVVDMLDPIETFIGDEAKPRFLVFDNCVQAIDVLNTLSWKMVRHQRNDWRVDLGDAIKIAVSMVANDNIGVDAQVNIEELSKPKLVYRPRGRGTRN